MKNLFKIRRQMLMALAALAALAEVPAVLAQEVFPSKPIQVIVPFSAGSATDSQLRILAQRVQEILGQPVVIMNVPGVGGTLGPGNMARTAKPDGYTISTVAGSVFRLPYLQKTNYDPETDFTYIMGLTNYNFGIAVRADSPWMSVADMVAAAKATPDKVRWGGVGQNSAGYIGLVQLSRKTGFELTYVPYKGGANVVTDLLGGHITVMGEAGWGPMVDSGKFRLLALMGDKSPRYPDVPTLRDLGYGIHVDAPVGLAGPKGMDPRIVKILHDAFHEASKDPRYQEALKLHGQPYAYMNTADYRKWAERQIATEKKQIAELGLKAE